MTGTLTMPYDVVVIGAGIAGASLGAELAREAKVLVVEAEREAGYHATGRSAAFWLETYGGPLVQPLTAASRPWLEQRGFLQTRGALTIAREDEADALAAFSESYVGTGAQLIACDRAQLAAYVPGLREAWRIGAYEPNCSDIDSAGLHGHYLARLRRRGGVLRLGCALVGAHHSGGQWTLRLADGSAVSAPVVVNAAGAWADDVARICGVPALDIRPFRRTMAQLRVSPDVAPTMPLVRDVGGGFYFKPEGGRIWLSPHDEIPSEPCDAAPEEIDVALAIDRMEQAVDWRVEAVEHKWAGLRSFAPDRLPVYGFDPRADGFFWCAGQGGFGIQTAPAAARMAAQLVLGSSKDALTKALAPALYSPARFVSAGAEALGR